MKIYKIYYILFCLYIIRITNSKQLLDGSKIYKTYNTETYG